MSCCHVLQRGVAADLVPIAVERIEFSEDDESALGTARADQSELVEQLRREVETLKTANAQLQGDCKVGGVKCK